MAKLAKINPLSGPWRDNIVAEIARSTVEKPLCKEAKICKEAKKAKDQSCATCDWAKHFQKSPTGRLLRGTIGWCSCKVDWPDMPFFFAPSQSTYSCLKWADMESIAIVGGEEFLQTMARTASAICVH